MSQINFSVEGIVLRTTPFRDGQVIASVITATHGLISIIVKGMSQKAYAKQSLITPLVCGEFLLTRGKTELFSFVDGTPKDFFPNLRKDFVTIQAAGQIAQDLSTLLFPGKPLPIAYALFKFYLSHLQNFACLSTALSSFRLKLLNHEGLIDADETTCTFNCIDGIDWEEGEKLLAFHLTHCRHFPTLQAVEIPDSFSAKIARLFSLSTRH